MDLLGIWITGIVIGYSHDACFACRMNKCFKIIDSVQHLLEFLFFSSYSKNGKYPNFCWTEMNAGPKYLTLFGNVYNLLKLYNIINFIINNF